MGSFITSNSNSYHLATMQQLRYSLRATLCTQVDSMRLTGDAHADNIANLKKSAGFTIIPRANQPTMTRMIKVGEV